MKSFFNLKHFALVAALAITSISITSCEDDETTIKLPYDLTRGVVIANEGSFGASNSSLSMYYPDGDSIVNDLFSKVNNRPLGDVFQSIGFSENFAYLIINASNKIEVVDKRSCEEVATITNLESPRYFTNISSKKAYVSLWGGNGKVGVLNTTTNSIEKTIVVGTGPEKMVVANSNAYVANCGGWGTDNRVSVINTQTDEVSATITVGDNPKDLVVDKNDKVWVLCSGNVVYQGYSIVSQTSSKLIRINPKTNAIEKTIDLGETYHPSQLEINSNGDVLYYGGDWSISGIFALPIASETKATTPLVDDYFYGFNVDPESGIIYGLQAPTFTNSGSLKRYNPTGEALGTFTLGVGPNGAYFAD